MSNVRAIAALLVFGFLALPVQAQQTNQIKKYLGETVASVRATPDPVQKREILDQSLSNLSKAIDRIESAGLIQPEERAGMETFESTLQDKRDELAGVNGFTRVPDSQLDSYSSYVMQDVEQAAESVTISLVAALLVIIILILIV